MPRRFSARLLLALGALAGAYGLYLRSDAYRNGNRLFYRDGRPNRLGRGVGRLEALLYGCGAGPSFLVALETTGHRSGKPRVIPVVLGEFGDEQYLVSMLGERSPWVHNIRAADGRAAIKHGSRRQVHLAEVAPEDRAPVIKAYLGRALGARPHIPVDHDAPIEDFERIAATYPVFRVEPPG